MKRSGPLKRKTPLRSRPETLVRWRERSRKKGGKLSRSRHRAMKRRNVARRRALFKKQFGSRKRVLRIKSLPCEVTGIKDSEAVQNAHAGRSRGVGGTWRDVVPLISVVHTDFDEMGADKFEWKWRRTKQSIRDRAPYYAEMIDAEGNLI